MGEPATSISAPVERLGRLDGLRGLAACGVAFGYHAANHFLPGQIGGGLALMPLAWLQKWGWTLVDLFFVLSGFIFAHVYLARGALSRPGALGDFAVARFARLYPLHLLLLIVVAVLESDNPNNTPGAFVAHLFMVQALWHPVAQTFVGPTWSISVEVFCYALFARTAVAGPRPLALASGMAIVWGLWMLIAHGLPGGPWDGDAFSRGMLGFFVGLQVWKARDVLSTLAWPALAALLVIGLSFDMGQATSIPPITLLAWPAALLLALRIPAMESRVMLWLGDRSYAVYLIHLPVIKVMLRWFESAPLTGIALSLGITLLLAEASFRWIEQPARRAIRRAWDRRSGSETGPAAAGSA